jgi:hypothetical protein
MVEGRSDRSPGLGFNLLAAPSHESKLTVANACGFRGRYSCGAAGEFLGKDEG